MVPLRGLHTEMLCLHKLIDCYNAAHISRMMYTNFWAAFCKLWMQMTLMLPIIALGTPVPVEAGKVQAGCICMKWNGISLDIPSSFAYELPAPPSKPQWILVAICDVIHLK